MKTLFATVLATFAAGLAPASAADLFGSAPMAFPAAQGPTMVEVGSNWYIRGDVGMSLDQVPTLSISTQTVPPAGTATSVMQIPEGATKSGRNFTADIGVGYRYNDWLRFEGTYEYRGGQGGSNSNTVICPYSARGLTNQVTGLNVGVAYDPNDTCNGVLKLNQFNNMFLGNAYADLGEWWGVTPYVGAGAGLNINFAKGNLTYYKTSDGSVYAADLTAPGGFPLVWLYPNGTAVNPKPNIPFAPQNWNRTYRQTRYNLAFALMGGVGIQLSPSATLDLGYRFLDIGGNYVDHEFRAGIRYAIQ